MLRVRQRSSGRRFSQRCAHAALVCAAGLAVALPAAGCHRTPGTPSTDTGPPGRLPVGPDELPVLPGAPAIGNLRAYKAPKTVDQVDWQLAIVHLDARNRLSYHVPGWWKIDPGQDSARNHTAQPDDQIEASASYTTIESGELALATYAAQLAEGEPIDRLQTVRGQLAYITAREISVAPSDPTAARFMFHTTIIDIGGRVAKLEITYNAANRWRYEDLATAISGTVDVRTVL